MHKGCEAMDMIHFRCPSCGTKLKHRVSAVGRKTKCPGCGRELRVPTSAVAEHPPWEEAMREKCESAAEPAEEQIESQEHERAARPSIELVDSQDVEPQSTKVPPERPAPSEPVAAGEVRRGLNAAQMAVLWVAAAVLVAMGLALLRGMTLVQLMEGFGEGLKGVVLGSTGDGI